MGLYSDYIRVILGYIGNNGKENGNYRDGGISGYGYAGISSAPAAFWESTVTSQHEDLHFAEVSIQASSPCGVVDVLSPKTVSIGFLLRGLRHPPSPCSMGACLPSIIVATEINSILMFPLPAVV